MYQAFSYSTANFLHPSPLAYSSPCTLHPVELATLSAAADREVGHCKEEEDPLEQVATSSSFWWDGPGTALLLQLEVVEEVGSLLFFFWRSLLGEERELKRENS